MTEISCQYERTDRSGILMEVTKEGSYSHLVIRDSCSISISIWKNEREPLSRECLREPFEHMIELGLYHQSVLQSEGKQR